MVTWDSVYMAELRFSEERACKNSLVVLITCLIGAQYGYVVFFFCCLLALQRLKCVHLDHFVNVSACMS